MANPESSPAGSLLSKHDVLAVLLLAVTILGVNWQLLAGLAREHWDGQMFFAPYYSFVAGLARSGQILLWNPLSNAGSPDFAEPQIGAFSPVTVLFGLIAGPSPVSFRAYWLMLWIFGGLGMYVFSRAIKAPSWGAFIAGLSFSLSGYYIGHAQHTSVIYSFSFIPWILWRTRAALITGRLWPACEAGALWGVSALAGNPAVTIPTGIFLASLGVAWLPSSEASVKQCIRRYLVSMSLVAVVGTVILAPAYFSFKHETPGYSDRSMALARHVALGGDSLNFKWITTLANPLIATGTQDAAGWPKVDISYLPLYFGAPALVLAAFGFWQTRRWPAVVFLLTGLLFLGFALGNTLPLREWLYDHLPPTRYFRHPPMFRGFFIVALIILAAAGSRALQEELLANRASSRGLRRLAICALIIAAASIGTFTAVFLGLAKRVDSVQLATASLHLGAVWLGLGGLCALASRRPEFRKALPVGLCFIALIDLAIAHDQGSEIAYDLRKPHAIGGIVPPPMDYGPKGFSRAPKVPGNEHLYFQKPVFSSYTAMLNRFHTAWSEDPLLLQFTTGSNRIWFAAEAPTIPLTPDAFVLFQRRTHELQRPIVVRHERASLLVPSTETGANLQATVSGIPHAQSIPAKVDMYRANEVLLRVNSPAPGWVLITERWSRSWTATVNGREVEVDGGNFLFRLVPVGAGENVIQMAFHPYLLRELLVVSWLTLLCVAVGSIWRLVLSRKAT